MMTSSETKVVSPGLEVTIEEGGGVWVELEVREGYSDVLTWMGVASFVGTMLTREKRANLGHNKFTLVKINASI